MDNDQPRVRWQDLSGQERYQVIELMRRGKVEIKQLCESLGVSRQTLYRAMEAADQASIEALTRKRRGRKPQPASETQIKELQKDKKTLEKQLHRMSQKYEIAQTLLDLQRRAERGEVLPGEKKNLGRAEAAEPHSIFTRSLSAQMAEDADGSGSGHQSDGSEPLADTQADGDT